MYYLPQGLKRTPSLGKGISFLITLLILAFCIGCSSGAKIDLPMGSIHLIDHPEMYIREQGMPEFDELINTLGASRPYNEKILYETRPGFAWEWTQPLKFKVDLPPKPALAFGWGFSDAALKWGEEYKLSVTVTQGENTQIVADISDRSFPNPDGTIWHNEKVNLSGFESGPAEMAFAFEGLSGKKVQDEFILSSPRIYSSGRKDFKRVIFLGIDTLRADHLSCYGYKRTTTPGIDEWADGGTRFGYCVSASPWTFPSFSSMMTGRYPSLCGATTTVKFLPNDETTLAEILSMQGYTTGMIVNNIWTGPTVNLNQGFDEAVRLPVVGADETFAKAEEWLKANSDEDTFLFLHFMDSHVPYHPPQPFNNMFDQGYSGRFRLEFKDVEEVRSGQEVLSESEIEHLKALYDGEIAYLDSEFSKFTQFLESEGMEDNTLVIITADHGEEFFEHGKFEHGQSMYDEVLSVPLILRGPGIAGGKTDERVASTLDIFPTILEYLNIEVPDNINGSSLLKPLPEEDRLLISEQVLYGEDLKGLTDSQYRYIYHTTTGAEELYDRTDDPLQLHSVADDRKASARQYRAFLVNYITDLGAPWHIDFARTGMMRGSVTYSGSITCEAGFAKIDKIHFDKTDTVDVNGSVLTFRVVVTQGSEKQIDFITNDESTDVTFEILRNNALLKNEGIYIGPELDPMPQGTFTLNISDDRFSLGQPNLQRETHDGVFIWANPTRMREQLAPELTREMKEELKSLGYLN